MFLETMRRSGRPTEKRESRTGEISSTRRARKYKSRRNLMRKESKRRSIKPLRGRQHQFAPRKGLRLFKTPLSMDSFKGIASTPSL